MDQYDILDELEELVRTEATLVGGLRDPLDISRQLSVQISQVSGTLQNAQYQVQRSEVFEIILFTVCLAIRYRIPLYQIVPHSRSGCARDISNDQDFCKVLRAMARETDEIVRKYEGCIPAPPENDNLTLVACLTHVVEQALSLVDLKGADLPDIVRGLIRERCDRAASLEYLFHPSDAPTLRSFEVIQKKTACPYAKAARLWGGPSWDRDQNIDYNVRKIVIHLERFVYLQRWETLDGFVIGISDDRLVGNVEDLSKTLRLILRKLNELDRFKASLFDREVKSKEWHFEFMGTLMFLIVFSPLYDHESPRETYGEKSTFIMVQPQQSFVDNKALRDRERSENRSVLVETFSQRFANIRKRFAEVGKPYDSPIMAAPFEAPRYLKPLKVGDPEIEWWKDDQGEVS